jgi:hypothetical protein
VSRKKRPARLFFIAVFLIVVYFVLFPYPLGKELLTKPAWVVSVAPSTSERAATSGAADASRAAAPFRLGSLFGFVSPTGEFLYSGTVLYQVALSARSFVNYTRLGTDWILQDQTGARISSFSGYGYPLLSSDGSRIFNVKSDLSGIIELNSAGETLWSRDFPGLMTSISINADYLVVGLVNGTLLLLNRQGFPLAESKPSGSRIGVIFADAVNPDGSLVAALCGIDPQYLTVLRRSGATQSTMAKITLPSTFRREARMAFSPDGRYLAFEGEGRVGLFDPSSRSLSWITARGALTGLAFAAQGRSICLVSRIGTEVALSMVRPFAQPIAVAAFKANDLFVGTIDGQLLLGWDGMLMRIDVVEI